jgi:flagellar biosynthesis/type III secretory pathway M-ring protein FliF/YscJ
MRKGCLWEILLVTLILFLLIFFYLRYIEPYIKGTENTLRKIEEITGERKEKRKERKVRRLGRKELPESESTGIEEVDEYLRQRKWAQEKLKRIRKYLIPR